MRSAHPVAGLPRELTSCTQIAGDKGTGKSSLLLQAVSYAQSTDWIVLYLPSALPLVNSSTPHSYSQQRALFEQPALAASLLTKFAAANKAAFKALQTTKAVSYTHLTLPTIYSV